MSWVSFPGGAAVPLSHVYSPAANIAHPTINPDSFSLDIVRHTLNRNDVFEVIHLSSILVQVAQKDMRSKLNNYQIQALQTPIPDCLDDDDALTVLLEQWFNIFNAAFFGGELSGGTLRLKVSRGIVSDDPIFNTRPNRLAGIYWPHTAIVEVNLNTDFSGLGFVGSIEHMHIVTLLHEMLHAFLDIFGCKCSTCNNNVDARLGGLGWKGHGPAWANAAHYTAQSLAKQTLWPIHMNVDMSVAVEMHTSGWVPTDAEAATWGLSWSKYWLPLNREQWRTFTTLPAPAPQPLQLVQPAYVPQAPMQAVNQRLRGALPMPQNPFAVADEDKDDAAVEAENRKLLAEVVKWNKKHEYDCGTNPTRTGQSRVDMSGPGDNGLAREAANTERMQR